jgi:hypothetical protein
MMLYIKVYNILHVFLKIFSIDIYFCCKLSLIDMRICYNISCMLILMRATYTKERYSILDM